MKRLMKHALITSALVAVSFGASAASSSAVSTSASSMTTSQQESYAVGYNIGKSLKSQGETTGHVFNIQSMQQGLSSGFTGHTPLMTDGQM